MSTVSLDVREGRGRISGPLTFDTVPQLYQLGRQLFAVGKHVELDLANIERSDSAGLALLISWMRLAQQQSATLSFVNVPEQLLGLAKVGGVEQILVLNQ